MHLKMFVSKILFHGRLWYFKTTKMTSNIFITLAFGVGFKCPRKIQLETQWEGALRNCKNSSCALCLIDHGLRTHDI